MIETSLDLPGKFRNFWKMFGNLRVTFGQVLESSENGQKHRHQYVCLYNKKNITLILEDTYSFIFLRQEQYLTCLLRSIVLATRT